MNLIKRFKSRKALLAAALMVGVTAVVASTTSGSTDSDFGTVVTKLKTWMEGSLGKTFALGSLATGLGIGIVKQSAMSVVTGVGIALSAAIGPSVLEQIFTAAL
jgi:conjugal transfer pilus assembly protein TraA